MESSEDGLRIRAREVDWNILANSSISSVWFVLSGETLSTRS